MHLAPNHVPVSKGDANMSPPAQTSSDRRHDHEEVFPPAFANGDVINVVIETPAGSRVKYAWQPDLRLFKAMKFLATGLTFPHDAGFVPRTRTEGGSPLDVLVLSDGALAVGCLVECRVLGAFEVATSDKPGDDPNPTVRLVVVPEASLRGKSWKQLDDLGAAMVDDLAGFLRSSVEREGRTFELRGTLGSNPALRLVRQSSTTEG